MSLPPALEDLDDDPVSIVLDHLQLGCSTSGTLTLQSQLDTTVARGQARLYVATQGHVELQLRSLGTEEWTGKRSLPEGTGLVVTGPATLTLRSGPSRDNVATAEVLVGRLDYTAVEFPAEKRFLPTCCGGTFGAQTDPRQRAAEGANVLHEALRYARHESTQSLACQILAVELMRGYLLGIPGTWEFRGPDEHSPALVALLRDSQFGPMTGLLIRSFGHGWDTEELAQAIGLGRKAFCARLRVTSSLQPSELLKTLRMQGASRSLAMPEISLKQIPPLVGYRSLPAFAAAFARVAGMTLNESRLLRRTNWSPAEQCHAGAIVQRRRVDISGC